MNCAVRLSSTMRHCVVSKCLLCPVTLLILSVDMMFAVGSTELRGVLGRDIGRNIGQCKVCKCFSSCHTILFMLRW